MDEEVGEVIEVGSDLGWETNGRHDGKSFHGGGQVGQRGAVRRNEAEPSIINPRIIVSPPKRKGER